MKLTRLRLLGFKSFVDSSEIEIEPGLTGIVGPNGCGKSNLVEALRWAMGEGSHKTLRASAMDDVIFSGSGGRPARNTAEVLIALDNADKQAPAPFTDAAELEITRRIEREKGSTYRVNGREVRARDVQLLFADASTGARSPALVRQGQIGEIINAKPEARRRVLEEAAGIAGLHARRHESELKLRAAEQNLERTEDVLARMRAQLESLKRQARQAVKYRQLSSDIRRLESLQLARAHTEAETERDAAKQALVEAERVVAERTLAQGEAARNDAVAGHELPQLRNDAAAAAAGLERLKRAGEDLDREERQAREKIADLERRIAQLESDRAREETLVTDAAETLERFKSELAALEGEDAAAGEREITATARVAETEGTLKIAEDALAEASAALAARTAERDGLTRARNDAHQRLTRLTGELQRLEGEARTLEAAAPPRELSDLAAEAEAALAAMNAAEAAATAAETALANAREAASRARQTQREAETEQNRLQVEASTLARMLDVDTKHQWEPVIDKLQAERGYEAALAAALGEDLSVPLDAQAPVHWGGTDDVSGDPLLPPGVEMLLNHIDAPEALARRLAQIGVVSRDEGPHLQKQLAVGQRLVSREGDLWRWDGYTSRADAETVSARRLAGRNRLKEIEQALVAAFEVVKDRKTANAEHEQLVQAAQVGEQQKRDAVRTARKALEDARGRSAEAERQTAHLSAKRSALAEQFQRVTVDEEEARKKFEEAEQAIAALLPIEDLELKRDELRTVAEKERAVAADARAAAGTLSRERETRQRQRETIGRESASWEQRRSGAATRVADIKERHTVAHTEHEALDGVPDEVAAKRRALLSSISDADTAAKTASDKLAEGETKKSAAEAIARDAMRALGESREGLARSDTRRDAADERLADALRRYVDAVGSPPDAEARAGAAESAPSEEIATDLEKMRLDRDRLGAVNLRADEELTEVQTAHDSLVAESADLIEAIKSLRQGIQSLNREGRERLSEAFNTVNAHFGKLFTTLFGGGEAKLELIESDDPLEAGLEIVARPPGKKPQTLSLLSGGEQALTAMALIFAIFLTNPAPLCVLDEVDAPLDDANVDRFCDLLDAMRKETDTRFLVVTHNPVTMSRMDRLFGVTMAERGVSQLVSVDLEAAERLREAV
jgi:chromosome segregation protein